MILDGTSLFAAPSFEEQGLGMDAVMLQLGLLSEAFYDSIAPAEADAVDRLAAASGLSLPPRYRDLLACAGGAMGPLQIQDWRTRWDFRPDAVAAALEAKPREDRAALREAGHLAVALIGECLMHGFYGIDDICLYLETETGWLFTDDYDRGEMVYDCLQAFLLEWGHRLLDPRMAAPVGTARAEHTPLPPPGLLSRLHALVASTQGAEDARHVGGLLGVYRLHDSGVIVKASPAQYPEPWQTEILVEVRRQHRARPQTCAASAVLRALEAEGALTVSWSSA